MANCGDANRLPASGELVEDPVGANPQRVQPAELPPQSVTCFRLALEQAERVLDGVDQGPAELEQFAPGATGEDEPRQCLAGGRTALRQLVAKIGKGNGLPALDLGKASLQRGERVGVGEKLRRLLQRLVLVDRNQRRRWSAIAGDQHVITTLADVVEQAAQVAAQLSDRDRLRHFMSVHDSVHS